MAEDLHNDPLEEFFKKNFEEFEAEPEDGMWALIEAGIPPKPSAGWWLALKRILLPGVLLLGAGAIIIAIWQYREAKWLVQALDEKSEEVIYLEAQLAEATKSKTSSKESIVQMNSTINRENAEVLNSAQNNLAAKVRIFKSTQGQLLNTPTNKKQDLLKGQVIIQTDEVISEIDPSSDSTDHLSANLDAGPLAALPFLEPAFLIFNDTSEYFLEKVVGQQKNSPSFYYGAFAEVFWFNQHLDYRTFQNGNALKTAQLGWGVGMKAGLQLSNRLGFETGLGFRWYNFKIHDLATLFYTFENTSINAEGQVVGSYYVPTEGAVALQARVNNSVQNDGGDIEEGSSFILNYDLDYQLRYYTLPLYLTYTFGEKRLKTQLRGGVLLNATLGERLDENLLRFSFNRLSPADLELEVSDLKNNFLEMNLGLNLQYEWIPQIQVGLGTNFYHSISPMVSKSHQSLGLNLNLNYTFNSKESKR